MTLEAKRIEQQYYFDPAQATAANSGISGADQAKITSIHFFGIRKCFCIFSFHANLFYLKQIRVERTNILSDQKHFFVFAGNDNFITNNPSISLDFSFTRSSHANTSFLPFKVSPKSFQSWH